MNWKVSSIRQKLRRPETGGRLGGGDDLFRDVTLATALPLLRRRVWIATTLLLAVLLAGGAVSQSVPTRASIIKTAAALPYFNFLTWELEAVGRMIFAGRLQPQGMPEPEAQVDMVRAYLERTQRIGQLEEELRRLVAAEAGGSAGGQDSATTEPQSGHPLTWPPRNAFPGTGSEMRVEIENVRMELGALRRQQGADRPLVEAVLKRQVGEELHRAGLGVRGLVWPPVQFAFIEPPLKLTVSPRDRISTVHSRVLKAEYDPVTLGESERAIEARTDLSAHISRIGGMAVFPAMVVESSSLSWVLSTIAHEWVHHYLFLFPLGLRYASNDQATTLNETVSDIIGVEIGERVALRYYPEVVSSSAGKAGDSSENSCACNVEELWTQEYEFEQQRWERYDRPLQFDFRQAMRETRLHVDTLLTAGHVETAEAYMEARRRYFVEKGYPLRVLNQAYFAFNGNYATGAASSSSIGPQLQELRAESEDLAHFLEQVRWFTSLADLEKALEASLEEDQTGVKAVDG